MIMLSTLLVVSQAATDAGVVRPSPPKMVSPGYTLGGVSGFRVSVYGADPEAAAAGLTEQGLIAQVEHSLKANGIAIIRTGTESLGLGGTATLQLSVFVTGKVSHGAVLLSVFQGARLFTGATADPATWSAVQDLTPPGWENDVPRGTDGGSNSARDAGASRSTGEAFKERVDVPLASFCSTYVRARKQWLARQETMRDRLAKGDELLAAAEFENAATEYGAIDEDSAFAGAALVKLAEAYRSLKRYAASAAALSKAISLFPGTVDAASALEKLTELEEHIRVDREYEQLRLEFAQRSAAAEASIRYCAATTQLRLGLKKNNVTKLLGLPAFSSMGTCGGNQGVKRWSCETLTYPCANGVTERSNIEAIFSDDGQLQIWSVVPAL